MAAPEPKVRGSASRSQPRNAHNAGTPENVGGIFSQQQQRQSKQKSPKIETPDTQLVNVTKKNKPQQKSDSSGSLGFKERDDQQGSGRKAHIDAFEGQERKHAVHGNLPHSQLMPRQTIFDSDMREDHQNITTSPQIKGSHTRIAAGAGVDGHHYTRRYSDSNMVGADVSMS